MENSQKNSFIDFELSNGEVVKLTLTFGKLRLMKSVNNRLYERYNDVVFGKSNDFLDIALIIYVAYWCANFGHGEKMYDEDSFIDLVPMDMVELQRVQKQLTNAKKK